MRKLTDGEWAVEELVDIDDKRGLVYVLGTAADAPLECHLYRIPLDGSAPAERVTEAGGFHGGVALAHDGSCYVAQLSSAADPVALALAAAAKLYAAREADPAAYEEAERQKRLQTTLFNKVTEGKRRGDEDIIAEAIREYEDAGGDRNSVYYYYVMVTHGNKSA